MDKVIRRGRFAPEKYNDEPVSGALGHPACMYINRRTECVVQKKEEIEMPGKTQNVVCA